MTIRQTLQNCKKYLKYAFSLFAIYMMWFVLVNYQVIIYGLGQAYGQYKVIADAEPIGKFLDDPAYPPHYKEKILLIQEIRQFAFDSLGLTPNESYTTIYNQNGKSLIWNVTACPPFSLEAYQWEFPIVGSFPYKGFFDSLEAEKEAAVFRRLDFDADVSGVTAWSTLGILNDPILSSLLDKKEGSLANLIIHELTHGTLYVRNNIEYSENLADFVGEYGAIKFLKHKYGENSSQYLHYISSKQDRDTFYHYVLESARALDVLYKSMPEELSYQAKSRLKEMFMAGFLRDFQKIPFKNPEYYKYFDDFVPNNTFFMHFVRYRAKQNEFKEQFEYEFNGDFKAYLAYLKATYPSFWEFF